MIYFVTHASIYSDKLNRSMPVFITYNYLAITDFSFAYNQQRVHPLISLARKNIYSLRSW